MRPLLHESDIRFDIPKVHLHQVLKLLEVEIPTFAMVLPDFFPREDGSMRPSRVGVLVFESEFYADHPVFGFCPEGLSVTVTDSDQDTAAVTISVYARSGGPEDAVRRISQNFPTTAVNFVIRAAEDARTVAMTWQNGKVVTRMIRSTSEEDQDHILRDRPLWLHALGSAEAAHDAAIQAANALTA